jgi:hypothetical protein
VDIEPTKSSSLQFRQQGSQSFFFFFFFFFFLNSLLSTVDTSLLHLVHKSTSGPVNQPT